MLCENIEGVLQKNCSCDVEMKPIFFVGIFIFAVLIVILGVTVIFFNYAVVGRRVDRKKAIDKMNKSKTYSPFADRILLGIDFVLSADFNWERITSYDGLTLYARHFRAKENNDKVIVLFHGWTSIGFFDFSCIVKGYIEKGYDVFMVDQRAHGISEGKYTCFGIKERYDVISWVKHICSIYRENCKIVIEGISMGATTVLMASGLKELPDCVKGVIADCGFTSPADEFKYVLKRDYNLPPFPFLYTADIFARIFAGFSFFELSAENEVKKSELPLLILHGEADDFVPVDFGRRIFKASGSKDKVLITVKGARHGLSYFNDEERCKKALYDFLSKVFN